MESERRGNNVGKRGAHTNKGVTAASSAAYLLFDRSQEVGGGGAAGVCRVAVTTRSLSGHHGPFPLCVTLLHRLYLPAVVQSRLAAEAPSLTLQEDYKPVRMWTRRRHNDQKITVTATERVTGWVYRGAPSIITLQGFTLVFINLPNIPADTHTDFIVTLWYHYNTPMEAHGVLFFLCTYSISLCRDS